MQKNIIIAILALVVGTGVGYWVGIGQSSALVTKDADTHVMNTGTMSMSDAMHSMNASLEGKSGDEFDKVFLSEMIIHHQGAVEMAQMALLHAKHEEIKNLATAIIAAQNKEVASMKEWQMSWYK